MNDSKKLVNPKITPEIQAMIDSDDPGCGKVYTTNLCIMRHRAAKNKEAKGLNHGPCAYCPLILKHLNKTKIKAESQPENQLERPAEQKGENVKMTKKQQKKCINPGCEKMAGKFSKMGYCKSCACKLNSSKAKRKSKKIDLPGVGICPAPKIKIKNPVLNGTGEYCPQPAADTIHAKTVGDAKMPEIKTSESKRPDRLTRADLLDLHSSLTETAKALMTRKNADYGATSDPFANFRMSALLHISPETGVLLRLQDKMARLVSFIEKGELKVTEESWKDSIIDIINYSVLLCGLLQEKTGKEA